MNAATPNASHSASHRRWTFAVVAVAPAAIYLLAAWCLAWSNNRTSILSIACFEPALIGEMTGWQLTAAVIMAMGAVLFLFGLPMVLALLVFRGRTAFHSTAPVGSLAVNSLALVLLCLVLRSTAGITRISFLTAWQAWSVLLAVTAASTGEPLTELRTLWQRHRMGILFSLVTVSAGVLLFRSDQFLQCFNGDGVESFELARSLRHHTLPTWEIEPIDRFGAVIVNPALINSYWTLGLQLLLGDGELATRLSYWVYWLGTLLMGFRITRHFGDVTRGTAVVLSSSVLLVTLWNTFYVGYNPYMADLANPGVPDALFTLCLLLSFDALLQQNTAAWIVATILGSLVLYAGPVMFVLTVSAAMVWGPLARKRLLRDAAIATVALGGIAGLYFLWGWHDNLLEGWQATLEGEYVADFFAPYPRSYANVIFTGYFILGCGGLPALAAVTALFRSPWERTVATVVLGYLAVILCSASKNLHYLVPLLPPVVVLWCVAQTASPTRRRTLPLPAIGCMALCLTLCWPRSRPVFTLNRDVGALTTFRTNSYQDACRWSDVVLLYDLDVTSWPMSNHVWVSYSSLEAKPTRRRPILVTTGQAPSGYRLRAGPAANGLKLCLDSSNIDWLRWTTSRRPETGLQRFPWVFQSIAVRPRHKLDL